jgi:hypothetical protein
MKWTRPVARHEKLLKPEVKISHGRFLLVDAILMIRGLKLNELHQHCFLHIQTPGL